MLANGADAKTAVAGGLCVMPVRMAYDYFVNKTMPPPPVIAQTLAIVGARRLLLLRAPASFLPFTAVSSQPLPFYLSRKLLCRLRRLHGDQVGSTTVQDGTCRINRIHLRHCAPPLHGRPACKRAEGSEEREQQQTPKPSGKEVCAAATSTSTGAGRWGLSRLHAGAAPRNGRRNLERTL